MKIRVLGAGVIGLTTAHVLENQTHQVEIWGESFYDHTCSKVAAAVIYPFLSQPIDEVVKWTKQSFLAFENDGKKGEYPVKSFSSYSFFDTNQIKKPAWHNAVPWFRIKKDDEVPGDYLGAYHFPALFVPMKDFLHWLVEPFKRNGSLYLGKKITKENFPSVFDDVDLVINCLGLGTRDVIDNHGLTPVQGKILRIKPLGLDYFYIDENGKNKLSYYVPGINYDVIGGTANYGDEGYSWHEGEQKQMIERVCRMVPELDPSMIEVLEGIDNSPIGLRPFSNSIRVALDPDNPKLIHNYGHGGSGVTVSWGCAIEVNKIIDSI